MLDDTLKTVKPCPMCGNPEAEHWPAHGIYAAQYDCPNCGTVPDRSVAVNFRDNDPCLKKVAYNEPIFVLRAQDLSAPDVIAFWIASNPQLPEERKENARQIAEAMRQWPRRKKAD